MLQNWISDIKQALSNTITEYVLFGMAVVPFLVAVGLATAAAVIWLAAAVGTIGALLVVAALFAIFGLFTLVLARSYEEAHPGEAAGAASPDASASKSSLLDGSAGAVLGLVASHPSLAFSAIRIVIRNLPALLTGAVLGSLLVSDAQGRAATGTSETLGEDGVGSTDPVEDDAVTTRRPANGSAYEPERAPLH